MLEKIKFESLKPEAVAEATRELTEQEKETLTTLRNYVNEKLKTEYKKGETLIIPLTGWVEKAQPVGTKLVTEKVVKELVATFEQTWNVLSTHSARGRTVEFSAIKSGEEPEATRELTEQEKETLTTLRNYVNEKLKTEYKKGETLIIPLTGWVEKAQPVGTKLVTEKVVKELVATFEQTWNVLSTHSARGRTVEFSEIKKE